METCFRVSIESFKREKPNRFIGILIIANLVIFAIPIYFLQKDIKESIEYHQRDNYKFITIASSNATYYYYILRQNATVQNCSTDSRFTQNYTNTFDFLVSHGSQNIFFIVALWFNLGMVCFLMLFKLYSIIREIYSIKSNSNTTHRNQFEEVNLFKLIFDKIRQESWTHATLSAATFYATIFDYSDICLKSLSAADVYAITWVGVTILLPVTAAIWTILAIGCTKYVDHRCKPDCGLLDVDPIAKKINCCGNKTCKWIIKIILWGAFILNAPIHMIGIILWFVMVIGESDRIDAILILVNTIITITIEIFLGD